MSWCCALVYREVPPFKQTTTNLLNMCTLQQITLTFFMATLIETGALNEYGGFSSLTIGSVLTVVNTLFIFAAVGFAWRFFRVKSKKENELQNAMAKQLCEFDGNTASRRRRFSADGSQQDGDGSEELPAVLKEFVPICHTAVIMEASKGLLQLERAFLQAHQHESTLAGMSKKGRERQGIENGMMRGRVDSNNSEHKFTIGYMNISLPKTGVG